MLHDLVSEPDIYTWIGVDESTKIKAPPKHHKKRGPLNRSARAIELRWRCEKARIASGTPAIKSPLDLWAQLRFLSSDVLPFGSYHAFKMRYSVMGGWGGKQVLFHQNLSELAAIVDGVTYRVMKEDCLDLPPKVFVKHPVNMLPNQAKAYAEMRKHLMVVLDSNKRVLPAGDAERIYGEKAAGRTIYVVDAPIVLTQRMRLQQITAGFLPILEENEAGQMVQVGIHQLMDPAKNPKIVRSMELIEETDEQFIIWVKFHAEAAAHLEAISKMCKVGLYSGCQGNAANERDMRDFRGGKLRGIIANAQRGGVGTNMQMASMANYPTNEQATELRVQSEDRMHRIGQDHKCTYNDIYMPGTVDMLVIAGLRSDKKTSDEVMGDDPKEWI
jgi:hypothetical protein